MGSAKPTKVRHCKEDLIIHHESGFYLGVWASNVEFNVVNMPATDNDSSLEIDVYAGLSGELANGLGWDVGALYYFYPDQNEDDAADYDFLEFYGSLSYTWDIATADIGVAYSTDFYGEDDEAIWWHGGLGLDMGMVNPYVQVGYQDVEGDKTSGVFGGFDYTYYAVGVSAAVDMLTFDLSWQEASNDCPPTITDDDLCEALVFSVSSSW